MIDFDDFWQRAVERHGEAQISARLPVVRSARELAAIGDDRYLSELSRRIFRAGLKHSLVDGKWPAFEEAFWHFDPQKVSLMSDEMLEKLAQDKRLIRHWGKLKAVRINAQMICDYAHSDGSFAVVVANWPVDAIVRLWRELQQRGAHLGGQSASAFLRMVGKDCFRLTPDVVAALRGGAVVDRVPSAQRDLLRVQEAFNHWHTQSGRPLAHISQILAMSQGEIHQA